MADDENTKPPVSEELFQLLTEDGGLKKRIIKESQGPLPPNGANLKVHYVGTLYPDDITFDSSRDRNVPFTFLLGEGQVIKGWDEGVKTMRVGEVAELICSPEYAYGKRGQPPQIPENATLKFEVELLDFTDGKTVRTPAQKISDATKKKEEGNDQFKKGSFKLALFSYQKGKEDISDIRDCTTDEMTESRNLAIALGTNIAACHLKLEEWSAAAKVCHEVLERDPENVKAFYRLGQAHLSQEEYEEGIAAINKGLEVAPDDANLKSVLALLTKKQAEFKKKEKSLYANMFK